MRIALTGGTGYTGSTAHRSGCAPRGRGGGAGPAGLAPVPSDPAVAWVEGDLSDPARWPAWSRARTPCRTWRRSTGRPAIPTRTTATSTSAAPSGCWRPRRGRASRRFVHTSTVGVHGDVPQPARRRVRPLRARRRLPGRPRRRPRRWPCDYHRARGLPVAVVRPGAIYGPGETRLLKLFRAIARGPLRGRRDRDAPHYHPVYIDDLRRRVPARPRPSGGGGRGLHRRGPPLRLPGRAGRAHRPAHRRARASRSTSPPRPSSWPGRPLRGALRAVRDRAAAAPPARGLLDEEPRVLDREGAARCSATSPAWTWTRASRAPPPGTGRRAGCDGAGGAPCPRLAAHRGRR